MADVPHDIWKNVASYLPKEVPRKLYGVNHSLFSIGMSARYEFVQFLKFDQRTKWLCRNISNPIVGDAVRRVDIQPWDIQPRIASCRSWTLDLWSRFNTFLDPGYPQRREGERIQKKLHKSIILATGAIRKLRNVQDYAVHWDGRPYHPEFFRAFLNPVLCGGLQCSLEKLRLKVPLGMLRPLSSISLPRLQELELSLCSEKMSKEEINETFNSLTVFVNNLYPSLTSLTIISTSSSVNLDLSLFFTHLGRFPHLSNFMLSIPFDGGQLSSPLALYQFLDNHRDTLRYLRLRTSSCSVRAAPIPPQSIYWLQSIVESCTTPFPYLRGLELALRPLKADLTIMMHFLASQASSLQTLAFNDRSLVYDEVKTIIDILLDQGYERLTQLRLKVRYLTPELMDLLASKLPHLERLGLSYCEVKSNELESTDMVPELQRFQVEMSKRDYAGWKLGCVTFSRNCRWQDEVLRLFNKCIPSLEGIEGIALSRM